jgi:lipoprotein-anchoring transpeptidase ErfK/SrfK
VFVTCRSVTHNNPVSGSSTLSARRGWRSVALLAALGALPLSACSTLTGSEGSNPSVSPDSVAAPLPGSTARLSVSPAAGESDVRPDTPIQVTVAGGSLSRVSAALADGTPVDGQLSADGSSWSSSAGRLPFGAQVLVRAEAVDTAGWGKVAESRFTTLEPTDLVSTSISPIRGSTVGVGMPVIVRLSAKPGDRAAVEDSLSVTSRPAVEGSWSWVGSRELHWRPREYWPAGTDVKVAVDLTGKDLGDGVWGDETREVNFSVGSARVHTVDIAAHTMTVTENGKVLRVIPVTTGEDDKWPTREGIKVIMTKERTRVMDSDTVDIPEDSADGYNLEVDYAMRLTNSGEFIHAAPWSVDSQGNANVSHGCTGMSDENAAWLFGITRVGDVVQYVNGRRGMEPGNGWTAWNVSWANWVANSAL